MEENIELTIDGTDCRIVIHHVSSDEELERVKAILAAYQGAYNEYTDYFCYFYDEEQYEANASIGSCNIIPEGRFKGYTIQDVYSINGHYSLSILLQTIRKMTSASPGRIQELYEEAIHFTVPLIRRQEIELDDFIHAYKPFLKGKGPTPEGDVEDWLKVPPAQQAMAYRELVDNITRRMENSLLKSSGK